MGVNNKTYLSFVLAGETFAVNVHEVLEVLDRQELTKIPRTPDFIRGVMNFRGEVLPVVEMRVKLQLLNDTEQKKEVVIVFDLSEGDKHLFVGAVVDGVKDVTSFNEADIDQVPQIGGTQYDTDFVYGMVKQSNGQYVMLLNVKEIFSKEEIQLVKNVSFD